jgi:VanZ family protein
MKKIIRFIPAFIWMLVIFYFSSRQTTGIGGDSYWFRFAILKSFHVIEYCVLFLFVAFAFNFKSNLVSIIIAYFYGCTDEFHQTFISGRTGRFRDTFFDLSGILIGFLLIKLANHFLKPKTKA